MMQAPPSEPTQTNGGEAPATPSYGPNNTLYVRNLNQKIKLTELKKSLMHVFSQFGPVMDIHAKKTYRMRGQAWIVFSKIESAHKAFGEMQNFNFYSQPMRVEFAKLKSDLVSKADGTFVHRPKRKKNKRPKFIPKAKKQKLNKQKTEKKEKKADIEPAAPTLAPSAPPAAAPTAYLPARDDEDDDEPDEDMPAAKAAPPSPPRLAPAPPHRILFVENLPDQCNSMMLQMLFQQYPGFKEARLVPSKPGIAFVEYQDIFTATTAKNSLQGFKITPTNLMKITFGRQ